VAEYAVEVLVAENPAVMLHFVVK